MAAYKTIEWLDASKAVRLLDQSLLPGQVAYATFSEGFRPGGVNRTGDLPPYKADFLTNYEVGWKTSWLANSVRFNGAVFVEDWEDFQFSFLGPSSVTQIADVPFEREVFQLSARSFSGPHALQVLFDRVPIGVPLRFWLAH